MSRKNYFDVCEDMDIAEQFDDIEEVLDADEPEYSEDDGTEMPDAATSYIRAVNQSCPARLSPTEAIELGRIMKTGTPEEAQKARTKLIEGHLAYALKYARDYLRQHRGWYVSLEELIQSANMGLMKAVDRYDYSHGVSLTSYAKPYLTKELSMCLCNAHRDMPLSEHYKRVLNKLHKFCKDHPDKAGDLQAIAEEFNITLETAQSWIDIQTTSVGLWLEPIDDNGSAEFESPAWECDYDAPTPAEDFIRKERDQDLRDQMQKILNKLEFNVISMRSGMVTEKDGKQLRLKKDGIPTFEDIGTLLGCGKTRACQAYHSGLEKLRARLKAEDFYV